MSSLLTKKTDFLKWNKPSSLDLGLARQHLIARYEPPPIITSSSIDQKQ
jgi:hypothetical protein